MTPEDLRAIVDHLKRKVYLREPGADGEVRIGFEAPSDAEVASSGLDLEGYRRILDSPWWDEMVSDIVDTPEMCDADDSPEQVLEYARDVVSEYLRKRVGI